MISATMIDVDTYEVVIEGPPESRHTVTLSPGYYRELSGGGCTQEWVIVQSFKFLLEREPAGAILKSFDLPVIGQYFPEYENEIKSRLQDR